MKILLAIQSSVKKEKVKRAALKILQGSIVTIGFSPKELGGSIITSHNGKSGG